MLRIAMASSARAIASGPTSIGRNPIDLASSSVVFFASASSCGNKSIDGLAVDLRVGLLRREGVIERFRDLRLRHFLLDLLRCRGSVDRFRDRLALHPV